MDHTRVIYNSFDFDNFLGDIYYAGAWTKISSRGKV